MKTAIVIVTGSPGPDRSSLPWREAFAEGLRRRGWRASVSTEPAECDLMVMWGVRRRDLIGRQRQAGREVCILERGYIGDRFSWTSVSFGGGLNGYGDFRSPAEPQRFHDHFSDLLKPWKKPLYGYALIMGQVPGDQSIRNVLIENWYREAAAALSAQGHDVRFRPHPRAGRNTGRFLSCPVLEGTLSEALAGASVVMTYNSNSGVDSVLCGRPTIATDRGSMAWEVAGHTPDEIIMPEREAWAYKLAWKQWSRSEIVSGYCAERLGL